MTSSLRTVCIVTTKQFVLALLMVFLLTPTRLSAIALTTDRLMRKFVTISSLHTRSVKATSSSLSMQLGYHRTSHEYDRGHHNRITSSNYNSRVNRRPINIIKSSLNEFSSETEREQTFTLVQNCFTAEGLESLGGQIASIATNGDVILLVGDLGAGKTTFTRGLIRAKHEDPDMRVTSPSYLLDNGYNLGDEYIHHIDLYRLPTGSDLSILGIPEIYSNSLCIIEWPQRMAGNLPACYLLVTIRIVGDESRKVEFTSTCAAWIDKLKKICFAIDLTPEGEAGL